MNNAVRQYRKLRKLTLHELSMKTDLRLAHISEIERGKVVPRVDTARKLADALVTTIDALFPAA